MRIDSQCKYGAVARGEASIYLRLPTSESYREKIWDHAAGWMVVNAAGGRVTDARGQNLDFSLGRTLDQNRGIIATNGHLHDPGGRGRALGTRSLATSILKKVLITGGAGFIGSNFVRLLADETDYHLVVLDKLTYAGHLESLAGVLESPRIDFIRGDIADRTDVQGTFEKHGSMSVVNFAAESHVDRSIDAPSDFVNTNVHGTFELLEAFRGTTSDDHRFLHVSTDEVFGSLGPEGAFTESTAYDPSSPYSASKAAADHLVRAYHRTVRHRRGDHQLPPTTTVPTSCRKSSFL